MTPTNLTLNVTPFNNILTNINFIKFVGLNLYYIEYQCKTSNKSKII
jgi:hypothetical protein